MVFSLWLYLPLLAALVAVLLFGADRLAKAGAKGVAVDISLNDMYFIGFFLTLAVVVATVAVFTGALFLVWWFFIGAALIFTSLYCWRRAHAASAAAWLAEQYAEEEARVAEAARLDPANAAAWARLAEISERKGDYASALRYLRKACELEPGESSDWKMRDLKKRAVAACGQERS